MAVNEQERRAIAFLVKSKRDTVPNVKRWDLPGIEKALERVQHLDLALVTHAAMRAAGDPQLNTPAPIGMTTSSCWREGPSEQEQARPPKGDDECPIHPGGWKGSCRACRADELAGMKPREARRQSRSEKYHARAAELRRVKAEATAAHCSCGVPRENCIEHRNTPVEEPPSPELPEGETA